MQSPRSLLATPRHAGLQIVTRESALEELIFGPRAGDIDFIFGPMLLCEKAGHLRCEALFDENVALLVGQSNALLRECTALKDLERARWILPPKSAPARLLLNSSCVVAALVQ
jgi:DNA-binding transcriptional LysR family regulator